MIGRHEKPLLDATFYIACQAIATFHVCGMHEVVVDDAGGMAWVEGRPAPDFKGQEWKTLYVWHDEDPTKPMTSNAVQESLSQAFKKAGITSR